MKLRSELEAYFETGDTPTQAEFADLINSLRHRFEDVDYTFKGVATSATDPIEGNSNIMYIASTAGTYTNFGGLVVNPGEVCALLWTIDVSTQSTAWTKVVLCTALTNVPEIFGNVTINSVDATVQIEANGYTITAYQWEYSHIGDHFADVSGATTARLTVAGTSPLLEDNYVSVRCKLTIGTTTYYTNILTITKLS